MLKIDKSFVSIFLFLSFVLCGIVEAQEIDQEKTGNVIYKYRQYEKFDLDEMGLEGESGSPGDLSIIPRFQQQFKNKLPYRTNFVSQIKKAVSSVR